MQSWEQWDNEMCSEGGGRRGHRGPGQPLHHPGPTVGIEYIRVSVVSSENYKTPGLFQPPPTDLFPRTRLVLKPTVLLPGM